VDARTIHANPDKVDDICNNGNNGIIPVGDIHPNQHPAKNLIIMSDLSDDDYDDNKDVKLNNDDLSNDNKDDDDNKEENASQACAILLMMSHHRRMLRQKIKECADQDKRTEE
jgi:hypothetical protein